MLTSAIDSLKTFFNPKSIAVIGASREKQKVGHTILANLVADFPGEIYPINPKATSILSRKSYPSLKDLPSIPDLVVVVIPTPFSIQVTEEAGKLGVKNIIIISAGFKETGHQGVEYEAQLQDIIRRYHMRLIGPNCLGIINTKTKLNASFAAEMPTRGSIALMSQSGALGTAVLDMSVARPLFGLSSFVSLGNKADLDEADLLAYFHQDPSTKVILAYCESIPHGSNFRTVASAVTQDKPIIVLKSGTTSSGQKAVSSHTGSLAGSDAAYSAAFRQSGVIRAKTLEHMLDLGIGFAHQPPLENPNIAIVTNAGGPAILASDALERAGLKLARLHNVTRDSLSSTLPATASVKNPVDILGDALADRYQAALSAVVADEAVHGVLVILTPQSMTEIEETAKVVAKIAKQTSKPILASFMGGSRVEPGAIAIEDATIPNYPSPERAIDVFAGLFQYAEFKRKTRQFSLTPPKHRPALQHLWTKPNDHEGLYKLSALQCLEIAREYELPIPPTMLASSANEAAQYAQGMGWPVVLKIESPNITHKTEFKGVKVGLSSETAVKETYKELVDAALAHQADAQIDGCLVQKQIKGGTELFIGMKRDPEFGPLITFGLGGIYVEVLKDVSFRLLPLSKSEVASMLRETKAFHLIEGTRGQAGLNQDAIVELIIKIGQISHDNPTIQEIDINPVLATGSDAFVADLRVMI